MHKEKKIISSKYDSFHTIEPKSKIVSNFRIILSQCSALAAFDLVKFSNGYFTGFDIVLLSILYKKNAEIPMTLNELSWFGSSCFMMPVGSVLGGLFADRIGTRLLCIISTFIFFACILLFHFANGSSMLLFAQATTGLMAGMLKGPSFTYIAEITQPYLRSTLMATSNFCLMLGMLTGTVVAGHLYWRSTVMINLVFIVLGLIFISFLPESPYWLASKQRYQEAKLALAWYRGWAKPESVEVEFQSMLKNLKNASPAFLDKSTDDDESTGKSKRQSRLRNMLSALAQKTFYIPMLTLSYAFFINELGGGFSIRTFSMLIFKKFDSPIRPHTASSILMAIPVVGGISFILTIHLFGKRKLAFSSLVGCGVLYAIAGTYGFLKAQNSCIAENHALDWIPTICILIGTFLSSVGMGKITFLLNSELYSSRFRQIGGGIGHALNGLYAALLNKVFLYMVNSMTISGVFVFFAVVNFVGFITLYFILPETEGKSLREIEDHYASVKCLKDMARIDNKDRVADKCVLKRPLFNAVHNPM